MIVLMVGVMGVAVLVRQCAMGMPMPVLFRQMQVDTHHHHQPGRDQRPRDRIAQDDDSKRCTNERRGGEMGPRPHRAQVTPAQDEQPWHKKPGASAPPMTDRAGIMLAPKLNAGPALVAPSAAPLITATCTGSAVLSFRVRLLSMPQAGHAPSNPDRAELDTAVAAAAAFCQIYNATGQPAATIPLYWTNAACRSGCGSLQAMVTRQP